MMRHGHGRADAVIRLVLLAALLISGCAHASRTTVVIVGKNVKAPVFGISTVRGDDVQVKIDRESVWGCYITKEIK